MTTIGELQKASEDLEQQIAQATARAVRECITRHSDLRRAKYSLTVQAEHQAQPHAPGYYGERGWGPELDQWLPRPMTHECIWLAARKEDFTHLDESAQRFFILLAAEVLYGPNFDAEILVHATMDAMAPV